LTEIVPQAVQDEVKACYSALLELLRHFWTCFPVSSKSLEEKVNNAQERRSVPMEKNPVDMLV
jgi:transcription initiation factor TFIIH subunit 1